MVIIQLEPIYFGNQFAEAAYSTSLHLISRMHALIECEVIVSESHSTFFFISHSKDGTNLSVAFFKNKV